MMMKDNKMSNEFNAQILANRMLNAKADFNDGMRKFIKSALVSGCEKAIINYNTSIEIEYDIKRHYAFINTKYDDGWYEIAKEVVGDSFDVELKSYYIKEKEHVVYILSFKPNPKPNPNPNPNNGSWFTFGTVKFYL